MYGCSRLMYLWLWRVFIDVFRALAVRFCFVNRQYCWWISDFFGLALTAATDVFRQTDSYFWVRE